MSATGVDHPSTRPRRAFSERLPPTDTIPMRRDLAAMIAVPAIPPGSRAG